MAAVAAVCMQEEEEREIQEAMVATGMSIYPDEYDAILYRRQRMLSLGNVSAPPMLNRGYRFSSVGKCTISKDSFQLLINSKKIFLLSKLQVVVATAACWSHLGVFPIRQLLA